MIHLWLSIEAVNLLLEAGLLDHSFKQPFLRESARNFHTNRPQHNLKKSFVSEPLVHESAGITGTFYTSLPRKKRVFKNGMCHTFCRISKRNARSTNLGCSDS